MPEFNFDGFDQIKPNDKLNQRLLQKISNTLNKKESNMLPTKLWKFALVASLVVGMFALPFFSGKKSFIDYAGFLNVYASEIEQPLLELADQESILDQSYINGNLTKEEYDAAKEELRLLREAIELKKEELKEDYHIKDELDLKKVIFAKNEEEDARLKMLYEKQQKILLSEKESNEQQEQLEADYKDNTITLEEYIAKKQAILSIDNELTKLEDRIEQINKSSYFSQLDPKTKQEIQSIYHQKQEIDKALKKMVQEEKQILQDLRKNKISYEEYIDKKEGFVEAKKELAKLDQALLAFEDAIIDGQNQTSDSTEEDTSAVTETTSTNISTTLPNRKQLDQERKKLEQAYRSHSISKQEYDEKILEVIRLESLLNDIQTWTSKITTTVKTTKEAIKSTFTTSVSPVTSKNSTKQSNANSNETKKNDKGSAGNTKKNKNQ